MFIDANQSRKVNPIEIMTQIKKSKNNQNKKNWENQITEKGRKSKTLLPVFFQFIFIVFTIASDML